MFSDGMDEGNRFVKSARMGKARCRVVPREEIVTAKQRLTIYELGQILFPGWRPGSPCHSPFREDRKPSFSVYDEGRRWKDHASGESGDVVSFYAKARGDLEMAKALQEFVELANGRTTAGPVAPVIWAPREAIGRKPNVARFRQGMRSELEQVAASRNLDLRAVELAERMGVLRFGLVAGYPSWVLTDKSGLCAEGRRLDGKPYPEVSTKRCQLGERKSHAIRYSRKAWPVGILPAPEYRNFEAIALVEGAPDALAVLHFMLRQNKTGILPVALLGRGQGLGGIHPDALELFRGKRVRIYPHADLDGGGYQCAQAWSEQLKQVNANVDFFLFKHMRKWNRARIKDLNDCRWVGRHFAYRLEELFAW